MRILPATLALIFLASVVPVHAELIDGVVLRVDNRMATLSEYELRRGERVQQILSSNLDPQEQARLLENAGRASLLEVYQELLLLARADQLGLRTKEEDVEQALDQNRERMGLATRAELEAALAQNGRTIDDLRERTRLNLLVQQVVGREVQAKAIPTEEEMRRYYRENPEEFAIPEALKIREVIVQADHFDDGASLDEAAKLWRARLDAGLPLDEVAAAGSATGETSGVIDLDWVQLSDLDAALALALTDAAAGSIVGPVAARGGLHLVEVLERKPAGLHSFSDAEEQIRRKLASGRFEELLEALFDQVEAEAWIVVNAPADAEGFMEAGEAELVPAPSPPADAG